MTSYTSCGQPSGFSIRYPSLTLSNASLLALSEHNKETRKISIQGKCKNPYQILFMLKLPRGHNTALTIEEERYATDNSITILTTWVSNIFYYLNQGISTLFSLWFPYTTQSFTLITFYPCYNTKMI